jgi:hypothetical protein
MSEHETDGRPAMTLFTNRNAGRAVYERVVRAVKREDQAAFLRI